MAEFLCKFHLEIIKRGIDLRKNDAAIRRVLVAASEALRVAKTELVPRGDQLRVALGLSGGMDSCVLFHVLLSLKIPLGLELTCIHVDHGLREESGNDAEFVSALCQKFATPCHVFRGGEKPEVVNQESWARSLRYGFFEQTMARHKIDLLLTAHHQRDQAETLLFRLITGRLARDGRCIRGFDLERKILRPLIEVSKEDLEIYAEAHHLEFVEDSSNLDTDFTRNALRLSLIPQLSEEYNPRIISSLSESAKRMSEDEEYLWREAASRFSSFGQTLLSGDLREIPPALCWRVLMLKAVEDCGKSALCLGYRSLSRLRSYMDRRAKRSWSLDLGAGLSCKYGPKEGVSFYQTGHSTAQVSRESRGGSEFVEHTQGSSAQLFPAIPGSFLFAFLGQETLRLEARFVDYPGEEAMRLLFAEAGASEDGTLAGSVAYFDTSLLALGDLGVRERRPGDSLDVWMRGSRKLKKLLQEKAVPRGFRSSYPIITSGETIIWVPGVARSKVAAVSSQTISLVELSVSIT